MPWRRLAERRPAEAAAGRNWGALVATLLDLTYEVADITLAVLSRPYVSHVCMWGGEG